MSKVYVVMMVETWRDTDTYSVLGVAATVDAAKRLVYEQHTTQYSERQDLVEDPEFTPYGTDGSLVAVATVSTSDEMLCYDIEAHELVEE